MLFARKTCAEMIQSFLRDNPSVSLDIVRQAHPTLEISFRHTKPSTVRLNPPWLCLVFAFLKSSGLDDLSILVANGFTAAEHLESSDLFRIAVEVLALHLLQRDRGRRASLCIRSFLRWSHACLAQQGGGGNSLKRRLTGCKSKKLRRRDRISKWQEAEYSHGSSSMRKVISAYYRQLARRYPRVDHDVFRRTEFREYRARGGGSRSSRAARRAFDAN